VVTEEETKVTGQPIVEMFDNSKPWNFRVPDSEDFRNRTFLQVQEKRRRHRGGTGKNSSVFLGNFEAGGPVRALVQTEVRMHRELEDLAGEVAKDIIRAMIEPGDLTEIQVLIETRRLANELVDWVLGESNPVLEAEFAEERRLLETVVGRGIPM